MRALHAFKDDDQERALSLSCGFTEATYAQGFLYREGSVPG